MKTTVARLLLASFVAVPCLFAAEIVGLVPPLPLGPDIILGAYVGGGLLAFVCDDYQRAARRGLPRLRQPKPAPTATRPATPRHLFDWHHHTVSA